MLVSGWLLVHAGAAQQAHLIIESLASGQGRVHAGHSNGTGTGGRHAACSRLDEDTTHVATCLPAEYHPLLLQAIVCAQASNNCHSVLRHKQSYW
jgi:hypothetical protein